MFSHHIVFHISSMPRSPNVLLPFSVSNWNFLCIFSSSSAFLLSHLSHCLSVPLPPALTDQYKSCSSHSTTPTSTHWPVHKSCSSSMCNFVLPPASPTFLSPCSSTHLILCNQNCLFTPLPAVWNLYFLFEKLYKIYSVLIINKIEKCTLYT
jgi:hypothetical protein